MPPIILETRRLADVCRVLLCIREGKRGSGIPAGGRFEEGQMRIRDTIFLKTIAYCDLVSCPDD